MANRGGRLRVLAGLVGFGLEDARRRSVSTARAGAAAAFQAVTWTKWQVAGVTPSKAPLLPTRGALLARAAQAAPKVGLWLEFGVFRGESLRLLAGLTGGPVYGFDSFEGLPDHWGVAHQAGTFSTAGRPPEVPANVKLVTGRFEQTLPGFVREQAPAQVALLHVDSDLYSSARVVLEQLRSAIVPGTVIVFDEFTTLVPDDEHRAFREFLRTTGRHYRYLGCSPTGSVAVVIAE